MVDRGWVAGAWHSRPVRCVYHVCRQRVVPGGRNPVAAATVALRSYVGIARKTERMTAWKTRVGATLPRAAIVAQDLFMVWLCWVALNQFRWSIEIVSLDLPLWSPEVR